MNTRWPWKLPPSPLSSPAKKRTAKKTKPPVVMKVIRMNRFLDGLSEHEPRLHPVAVVLWCWLWRCERKGFARASERQLADRFGVDRKTIRFHLRKLIEVGFLTVARRGIYHRRSTIYRIRPVAKKPSSDQEQK